MGFIKKIWKDRISEFPTRRSLTKTDGTSELVTVARSEGMISEEGDAFSAENMNDFENRVANGFSELNKNFGGLTFAQNASGAWGYKVGGAGSVIPFKSLDIVYVGAITSSGSINVMSKCPNYKKMTAGDFLLDYQSMAVRLWDGKIGGSTINVSKYYDPSTGVLSLSNLSASSSSSYVRCTVGVYAKVS